MLRPRPKQRSKLQTGPRPLPEASSEDPHAPLDKATYHRPVVGSSQGAMPCETYQYDIVYDAFCNDKDFWRNWRVVECSRNSLEESVSEEAASIRVVLDLPPSQKLYPTAYTPGFPTLPFNARRTKQPKPERIAGLPPAYSVALEVHILEDARMMLDFQRSFRRGSIDSKYKWLDDIVTKAKRKWIDGEYYAKIDFWDKYEEEDKKQQEKKDHLKDPRPIAERFNECWELAEAWPLISQLSQDRGSNNEDDHSPAHFSAYHRGLREHPEALLRPPVGVGTLMLPEGRDEVMLSETLKPFSEIYQLDPTKQRAPLAKTYTKVATEVGATTIQVIDVRGFDVGDTVRIGEEELRKLVGFALAVDHPLMLSYPAGTNVEVISKARQHVYEQCTLVSAFGNSMTLPPRESGSWAPPPGKTPAQKMLDQAEGDFLERRLAKLKARHHAHDSSAALALQQ